MALALAGRNRGQAQYTPDHGIGLNSLHIENIHSLAMDIIHSELCITGSVRKKCKDCKNRYYREQYRNRVREKDEKIIKTRNVIIKKRSVSSDILCSDCKHKDKTIKQFCSDCSSKYFSAISKKYYRAKKQKLSAKCDQSQSNHPAF